RCMLAKTAGIKAAAFDPSGARFAIGGLGASITVARASDCKILRLMAPDRGRASSVVAGASVLVGDGIGTVSTGTEGDFRASSVPQLPGGEVTALAALADGKWVSGCNDGTVFLGTQQTKNIARLRGQPFRIVALAGDTSVLAVDSAGDANLVPVDGSGPKRLD